MRAIIRLKANIEVSLATSGFTSTKQDTSPATKQAGVGGVF